MESKKNTLLLSVGPYQLLSQYILLKQLGLEDNVVGVIRTDAPTDGENADQSLIDCEKWLCENFDLNFISKIKSIYKLWGSNKLSKLFGLFFLQKRIRRELNKNNRINFNDIEYVILTYRKDLGEQLILSSLKNLKKVHFVSDGAISVVSSEKRFALPFYLKIIGITNYYNINVPVYFYKESIPIKYCNIEVKILDQDIRLKINNLLTSNNIYQKWEAELFGVINNNNYSMLFLQPLEKYPDLNTNIRLYLEIIKQELLKSENKIIIKHHPREQKDILEIFKKNILNEFKGNIIFYDNHFLSSLPIEVYFDKLNINRVITLFSTAVYFTKDNAEIILYSSNILPEKFQNNIKETADFLNKKIDYLVI